MAAFAFDHDRPCAQTHASLPIKSADIGPDDITRILRLAPTAARRRGEVRRSGRVEQTNARVPGTRDDSGSRDLRYHLHLLLERLAGREAVLADLRSRRGCCLEFRCSWWLRSEMGGGPWFDHDFLRALARWPLDLVLDVYTPDDGEDPAPPASAAAPK